MAGVEVRFKSPLGLLETLGEVVQAVEDAGGYESEHIQADMGWAKWHSTGSPRSWLEVQLSMEDPGCEVFVSYRTTYERDRYGIHSREAHRVANRMKERVNGLATGVAPSPNVPAAISERQVLGWALAGVVLLSVGGICLQPFILALK